MSWLHIDFLSSPPALKDYDIMKLQMFEQILSISHYFLKEDKIKNRKIFAAKC